MSGMNVNEGPDRAEFEREDRYDLQSVREAVAEFEASGEPAIPLCDVDWGTDMVESERKSGGAQPISEEWGRPPTVDSTDPVSAQNQLTREINDRLDSVGTDPELDEFSRIASERSFSEADNWLEGGTRSSDRETEFRHALLADVDTVDADEAQTILTVAERAPDLAALCADGQLMVLRGAGVDRYPAFQFDRERSEIADVVAYANARVGAATDPWGTADWWRTPSRVLGDRSPMDVLTAGELTRAHVDVIGKYELS